MGTRGGHRQLLLAGRDQYFITDLAWAPGGHRVALAITQPTTDNADLFILTLRTRSLVKLDVGSVPDRYVSTVDWSPDGRTIVFSAVDYTQDADANEDHDLYFVRPDGTRLRQVTDSSAVDEWNPRWSPTGHRLLYTRSTPACPGAAVVAAADGSHPRRVPGCTVFQATWSPSGRRLLVSGYAASSGEQVVWTTRLDGSRRRVVTDGMNASWRPRRHS